MLGWSGSKDPSMSGVKRSVGVSQAVVPMFFCTDIMEEAHVSGRGHLETPGWPPCLHNGPLGFSDGPGLRLSPDLSWDMSSKAQQTHDELKRKTSKTKQNNN